MFLPFLVGVKSIGATRFQVNGFIAQFTISFASVGCIFRPLAFESSFSSSSWNYFIASKLNAGCSRYLDKIYKIFLDILDLKAGFPLENFFIWRNFFRSKTKSRIGSYFFTSKQLLTNENSAKSHSIRKNLQVENWLNRPS